MREVVNEGPFLIKTKKSHSNKPTRYSTQDCKSVFLERESKRERLVPTVAENVRMAIGLQNSQVRLKQETPSPKPPLLSPSSTKVPQKGGGLTSIRRVLPTLLRAGPTLPARRHGAASSGGRAPRERVAIEDRARCKANRRLGGGEPEFENGWKRRQERKREENK